MAQILLSFEIDDVDFSIFFGLMVNKRNSKNYGINTGISYFVRLSFPTPLLTD